MKTTLVMATTVNGFIAGPEDYTDWIKDVDAFYKTVASFGVCVMGKRTYLECVKYDVFPYKGALNIVMTHDEALLKKHQDHAIFTDSTPREILAMGKEKGFSKMLVIGGGHINGAFLKESLIDELVIDVHPFILSGGIKLFEQEFTNVNLSFTGVEKLNDGIVQLRYTIPK
jgi:dihydrofolate reductase